MYTEWAKLNGATFHAVARRLSVRLSVRPPHAGIVDTAELNISSIIFLPKGSPTILAFHGKQYGNTPTESP